MKTQGDNASGRLPDNPLIGVRILIVEDNEVNQEVVGEILQQWGCECDIAGNGQLALEALQQRYYNLILMDCQMPEMDGFEATRRIREMENVPSAAGRIRHVPIVALSASALRGDRGNCLAAGMDEFLSKPIDSRLLLRTICKTLGLAPSDCRDPVLPTSKLADSGCAHTKAGPFDVDDLLQRFDGKRDFVVKLLNLFGRDAAAHRLTILKAHAALAFPELKASAHAMKSASLNMKIPAVTDLASRIELLAANQQRDTLDELVTQLASSIEAAVAAVPQAVSMLTNEDAPV